MIRFTLKVLYSFNIQAIMSKKQPTIKVSIAIATEDEPMVALFQDDNVVNDPQNPVVKDLCRNGKELGKIAFEKKPITKHPMQLQRKLE